MDDVLTVAVIPTRFEVNSLVKLLKTIDGSVDHILVVDNGHKETWFIYETFTKMQTPVNMVYKPYSSVYEMWNWGWAEARMLAQNGPVNIAFLNDDIIVSNHTLPVLAEFLRLDDFTAITYPDYSASVDVGWGAYTSRATHSTYGHGGMSGFCFMLKGELDIPYVDENLKWWYGDDDLVKMIERDGYSIVRVEGLPIVHGGGASSRKIPNLMEIIKKDNQYFNSKYGESRSVP